MGRRAIKKRSLRLILVDHHVIYKSLSSNGLTRTNRYFRELGSMLKDKRTKAAIAARILRFANGLLDDVSPIGHVAEPTGNVSLRCGGSKSRQTSDIELWNA